MTPASTPVRPGPSPSEEIIEANGLSLEYQNLRKNGRILGKTIFDDGLEAVYDMEKRAYTLFPVKAGTSLIDASLCAEDASTGRLRFTCAHELGHWVLHTPLTDHRGKRHHKGRSKLSIPGYLACSGLFSFFCKQMQRPGNPFFRGAWSLHVWGCFATRPIKGLSAEPSLMDKIIKTYNGCSTWNSLDSVLGKWFGGQVDDLAEVANVWRNELAHEKREYEPDLRVVSAIRLVEHLNYCIVLRQAGYCNKQIKEILEIILAR